MGQLQYRSETGRRNGTLVIVRHGESAYNRDNRLAGTIDTWLTEQGIEQAQEVGSALRAHGFRPSIAIASQLARARHTASHILCKIGLPMMPILIRPDMAERHCGALTGMEKNMAREMFGEQFRHSYHTVLPPMDCNHPCHPDSPQAVDEFKIRQMLARTDLSPEERTALEENPPMQMKAITSPEHGSESLENVVARVEGFWKTELLSMMQAGQKVLISAHDISLRALSMIVEGMKPEEVVKYEIDNCKPLQFTIHCPSNSREWTLIGKELITGKGRMVG